MPKVSVEHKVPGSAPDTFKKIKGFFADDTTIQKLDASVKTEFSDATLTGKATGSQFKADIVVTAVGTGSAVKIVVDLPLLLTPFKGKIQEMIEKKLGKYLA
jgi:hypothetical protein